MKGFSSSSAPSLAGSAGLIIAAANNARSASECDAAAGRSSSFMRAKSASETVRVPWGGTCIGSPFALSGAREDGRARRRSAAQVRRKVLDSGLVRKAGETRASLGPGSLASPISKVNLQCKYNQAGQSQGSARLSGLPHQTDIQNLPACL